MRESSAFVWLPAHDPRTGKSAHQLEIRAPQNMTKRHRNLSYDILLERYGSLLSTLISECHFDIYRKGYGQFSDQRSDLSNNNIAKTHGIRPCDPRPIQERKMGPL